MSDQTEVRRRVAAQAMDLSATLVDALYGLEQLASQRQHASLQFVEGDFEIDGLRHLDAYTISALFDIVVPRLEDAYADGTNGGFSRSILLKVRPGGRQLPPLR